MTTGPGSTELDASAGFPALSAPARRGERRRPWRVRLARGLAPYALLLPTIAVIAAVLAYPLYFLVRLSFEKYGLEELIAHKGTWVGLDNYSRILHDGTFWAVAIRTVLFTLANVVLTMVLGTLLAHLIARLGGFMRMLMTTALVLVWAMPVVVAVNVWQWMVDFEFGVANYALTELRLGEFTNHDWFENPVSGLAVITALVVWGALPFVVITLYAGLAQVPGELVEAAQLDGAGPWRVFRDVTFPILKPIFVILTSLSVIWDFQVFNQVWLMRNANPTEDYFLMGVYSFFESFRISEYGYGAAIALVMVVLLFVITLFYIRQMLRIGEVEA
jgi:N,N'-diacetylchitobiose transport system permease protein